jgi:hypothetical protein
MHRSPGELVRVGGNFPNQRRTLSLDTLEFPQVEPREKTSIGYYKGNLGAAQVYCSTSLQSQLNLSDRLYALR